MQTIVIDRQGNSFTSSRHMARRFTPASAQKLAAKCKGEVVYQASGRPYPAKSGDCKGAIGPEAGHLVKIGHSWLLSVKNIRHLGDGIYEVI